MCEEMTWSEILSKVRSLAQRYAADGSPAWYRGHRNGMWELKSTAHRHLERLTSQMTTKPPQDDLIDILQNELKTVFWRFKADAWPLLQDQERGDWGILFTMQHFGIPTRLLDWTESFACAVFFAQLRRTRNEAAAIWVLDPQALNQASLGIPELLALDEGASPGARVNSRAWHPKWTTSERLKTIAANPFSTNPRMVAQQSVFTLAGDTFLSMDDEFKELARDDRLVKIVLPPDTFDDAEEYLAGAGLTAFTYYPDLEGLALKHEAKVERTIRDARTSYPQFFG